MNSTRQEIRSRTGRGPACPACGAALAADAQWCPSCGFTGAETMRLFPDPPPPPLQLLDAAGLWDAVETRRIETAREKLRRRFPQFRFHVCTVMLPGETSLPVFGFWLLNVCPFHVNETADDRAWTVLLLIDNKTGKCAVVPGYSAEPWLTDEDWGKLLALMGPDWRSGKSADAVIRYFENSGDFLDHAWKARGLRGSKKSRT